MQFKQLIVLTYAITAAGLAAGFASTYTRSVEEYYYSAFATKPEVKPEPMATIVTVVKALPIGHKLKRDDFELARWPADSIPAGAFQTVQQALAGQGGKYVRSALVAGEVVLGAKIGTKGSGSALSRMLPPGMRAVTIQVNEVLGVGGFVRPNDMVDILLTELPADGGKPTLRATRVILQNVKVLAMGQNINAKRTAAEIAKSATVAVSLKGAQKLALATTIGRISLALRNPEQLGGESQREVSVDDLKLKPGVNMPSGKMEVVIHRARVMSARDDQVSRIVRRY